MIEFLMWPLYYIFYLLTPRTSIDARRGKFHLGRSDWRHRNIELVIIKWDFRKSVQKIIARRWNATNISSPPLCRNRALTWSPRSSQLKNSWWPLRLFKVVQANQQSRGRGKIIFSSFVKKVGFELLRQRKYSLDLSPHRLK